MSKLSRFISVIETLVSSKLEILDDVTMHVVRTEINKHLSLEPSLEVICDHSNNPAESINKGFFNVDIKEGQHAVRFTIKPLSELPSDIISYIAEPPEITISIVSY